MSEAGEGSKHPEPSRTRIIGARVLTVLAILLALVGMVAFYVEHTALDEDGFGTRQHRSGHPRSDEWAAGRLS